MAGQLLDYAVPSALTRADGMAALTLGTFGGSWLADAAEPTFFDGVVDRAGAFATAMLVLGRVASTRFYTPPAMLAAQTADPVFTSTPDGLRLEAFSACAGVYARFDLDADVVDVNSVSSGVTNVDFNGEMRSLLNGVAAGEPMHLTVASAGVTVRTLDGSSTEKRVALPERWLRSFAESQVMASGMSVRAEPDVMALRRLVRDLPRTTPTASVGWVQQVAGGLRLASRESADSIGLAGAERLRIVEPLLAHVQAVRVFGGAGAASFWEFTTALGRLTLGLSPQKSRGFSGEGQLLEALSSSGVESDADRVEARLRFDHRIDAASIAADTDLTPSRVADALTFLAAQGLLGFDTRTDEWFHRPLPYDAALTEKLHPRLASANALVDSIRRNEDGSFTVNDYRVRLSPGGISADTCTCPWYGKHRGDRGPCKHVLGARMTQQRSQ